MDEREFDLERFIDEWREASERDFEALEFGRDLGVKAVSELRRDLLNSLNVSTSYCPAMVSNRLMVDTGI